MIVVHNWPDFLTWITKLEEFAPSAQRLLEKVKINVSQLHFFIQSLLFAVLILLVFMNSLLEEEAHASFKEFPPGGGGLPYIIGQE